MPPKLRGGIVGSARKLKQQLKDNGGGDATWVLRLKDEDVLVARFLAEVEGWFEYWEHYDETEKMYYGCVGSEQGCPGCEDGKRASHRWLAPIVDLSDQSVRAISLPKQLVDWLTTKLDQRHTLMDRNYELSRKGSLQDNTKYSGEGQSPQKMNLARYNSAIPDLEGILTAATNKVLGIDTATDDGDDDDEPAWSSGKRKGAKKAVKKFNRTATIADEDDEDDDDDDDVPPPRRRLAPAKKAVRSIKRTVKATPPRPARKLRRG